MKNFSIDPEYKQKVIEMITTLLSLKNAEVETF